MIDSTNQHNSDRSFFDPAMAHFGVFHDSNILEYEAFLRISEVFSRKFELTKITFIYACVHLMLQKVECAIEESTHLSSQIFTALFLHIRVTCLRV